MKKTPALFLLFLSLSFISQNIYAQNNISDKKITLNENQKPISSILNNIAKQSGLKFSYNPKIIDDKKIISIKVYNAEINNVLNQIFGGKILCKQIGNYLVLTKNIPPPEEIVNNAQTAEFSKEIIPETVIETVEKTIQDTSEKITLEIAKETIETSIPKSEISVPIKKNENESICKIEDKCLDSIQNNDEEMKKHFMALALATMITTDTLIAQHVTQIDTAISSEVTNEKPERENRYFNISFVHPLGIHGFHSAKSDFNFSLSVLGDLTGGTNGVELASLFNINRFGVRGAQFAAIFNLASTSSSNSDSTMRSNNLQAAAILNFTKVGNSVQFSGIYNIADNAPVQAAGDRKSTRLNSSH